MRKFRSASMAALSLILVMSLVAIWAPASDQTAILVGDNSQGDTNATVGMIEGCRTTPSSSGVDADGGWADAGGFKICWSISFDGTNWNYSYTFTNIDGSTLDPDLSHWILEVSSFIDSGNVGTHIFNDNFTLVGPQWWEGVPDNQSSNPDLPVDLYGIKLDTGTDSVSGTYTFQSTQPPVWGHFYGKDGGTVTAWNTGLPTGHPSAGTTDFTNWIPTPDTTSVTTTTTTSTTTSTTTTTTTLGLPTTTTTTDPGGTTTTTTDPGGTTTTTTLGLPTTTTTTDPGGTTTTTTIPELPNTTTTTLPQTTTTTPVPIPAANTWGLVALGLAFLVGMAWVLRVRRALR